MMNGDLTVTRRRTATRRGPRATAAAGGRDRVAAALARRGARERLVLALLLYERLFPVEVADALNLSVRQVERTYDALLAELRRSVGRAPARGNARVIAGTSRVRKAA